jgi:hypothetical protein
MDANDVPDDATGDCARTAVGTTVVTAAASAITVRARLQP